MHVVVVAVMVGKEGREGGGGREGEGRRKGEEGGKTCIITIYMTS